MTFAEWRRWVSALPWALRWFVPLVLVRPFVDTFYFLKDISPLLSPLYIVGVLTPTLIVVSLFSRTMPRLTWSIPDLLFFLWGGLMTLNALAALAIGVSLVTLEICLKLITPYLIYFFLRYLVRSRRDLVGVLTTFLYSTLPVFGMMIYERVVGPLEKVPTFTRGFYRYSGLFADVMGYSVYFVGAFLVTGYLYLASDSTRSLRKSAVRLGVVSVLCLLGLLHIHHNTSWGVTGFLAVILLLETFRRRRIGVAVVVVAIFSVLGALFYEGISEHVGHSLSGEVAVLKGESSEGHAFHGRMSRWTRYRDRWEELDRVPMLFGVSVTSERPEVGMIFGIHNDYLRILFCSGIVGLTLYLLYYVSVGLSSWRTQAAERFVIRGALAAMLLYSVSTVPTLYYPLLYLCMSIFAFAALPVAERVRSARASRHSPLSANMVLDRA